MPSIDLTGYRLTFDDEFNTRSISLTGAGTTWADTRADQRGDDYADVGFGRSSFVDAGSGYDPFKVANGALTITAVPDRTPYGVPGSWESGLITTQNNFSQTYGYFEVRADFSNSPIGWDAFWLLPNKQIPNPSNPADWQELDVVEHYGNYDVGVYSTIHTTDPANGIPWQYNRQVYSELRNPSGYHTYGVNWQSDKLSFYVDGQFVGSQATPSDMHSPMYMLVDLAVQSQAPSTGDPLSSSIDYVRAYSNDPNAVAVAQQPVSSPDGSDPGLYGASAATAATVSTAATAASPATTDPVFNFKLSEAHFSFDGGKDTVVGPNAVHTDVSNAHSITFADGTLNVPQTSALLDTLYYNASNPDVWAARVDASSHYDQYGWHEGRDPNAYFSTSGYLAVNRDVAAASMNPLSHFDQYGWKEGRDPSANFDVDLYWAHNPDVKAAGIDPLAFFLQHGSEPGRQAYAAIGPSSSFNHGSFDAEYYLLANPDVAKAAIASGGDTFAFAYQHFNTDGWHEGRNPNAFFDTGRYLALNPDVAAAQMNPLTHYDQYGWKEGRDASASFHTSAYLAINADVAAVQMDPLTHYLQYGAHEMRSLG